MREQIESARRLDKVEGLTLVDYFTVHLPVSLLAIDIIGLDRRPVPAPVEFCLRAIEVGLQQSHEICGFLGVGPAYGDGLLRSLCDGDYIGNDAFGQYVLLRRGKELLRQGGEATPSDRRIHVLWDPIQKVVLDRTLVYTRQRADPGGVIAPIANAFAPPKLDELDVGVINQFRLVSAGAEDAGAPNFEVLRVTGIHKCFGRYRQSLALIYRSQDGELTFRVAINGSIDDELTSACTTQGLPKLIGVDRGIANKAGANAIRKRYRELACGVSDDSSVAKLVQRRSVLLLNLGSIDSRLEEEEVDSLLQKKALYEAELQRISGELARLPVVPVRCHEVEYYLSRALESADSSIRITTTNPSLAKVDGEILARIRACLARRVRITIYISDRLGQNDSTLATLDRFSQDGHLSVHFLQNELRSVFEIEWDERHLLASNEPPLGSRRRPVTPREFDGFYISDERAVGRYRDAHMKFDAKDFLVRLKPASPAKGGALGARKRPRERVDRGSVST